MDPLLNSNYYESILDPFVKLFDEALDNEEVDPFGLADVDEQDCMRWPARTALLMDGVQGQVAA